MENTIARRSAAAVVVGLLAAGAAAVTAPPARANIFFVTETEDELNTDGDCSLREAIMAANTDAPRDDCGAGFERDTIRLRADDYVLDEAGVEDNQGTNNDLDITDDVVIIGAGPNRTSISGDDQFRVFDVDSLGPGGSIRVTMRDLGVRRGAVLDQLGAGIANRAIKLNLVRVAVTDNRTTGTTGANAGGGIHNATSSRLRISDTIVSLNSSVLGAGIANNGTLVAKRSLFYFNTASSQGGAIYSDATTRLTNVTISDNLAHNGGAIAQTVSGATTSFKSSTVFGNNASDGAFAGNIDLVAGTGELENTIVAGTDVGSDCRGSVSSLGHNLDSDNTCNLTATGDLPGENPRLRFLANNGGPTSTHALRRGSPALSAGAGCPPTDQRGVPRPQGSGCEIGAYEQARCSGTIVNRVGTPRADRIIGTFAADGFLLRGGGDEALAREGKDAVCAGPGNDHLMGERGDDELFGESGNDDLRGGGGEDVCAGGRGNNTFAGCEISPGDPGTGLTDG